MEIMLIILTFGVIQAVNSLDASAPCFQFADDGSLKTQWYDPKYMICCAESLTRLDTNLECCNGNKLFYTDKKICCNGNLEDRFVSKYTNKSEPYCDEPNNSDCVENTCCGGLLTHKDDKTICCNGKPITLDEKNVRFKDFMGCCPNGPTYDKRYEICCGNDVFMKNNLGCCNGDVFNLREFRCVNNQQLRKTHGICNNIVYNKLSDSCCEGHLTKDIPELKVDGTAGKYTPNTKCCGSRVITDDEACCDENLFGFRTHSIMNHPDLKCCGLGHFNSTSQVCLKGIAVTVFSNQKQCGNELIDTSYQGCCANKVPYNLNDHSCCEGATYCVIKKGERCCNGFQMRENEICCQQIKPCKKRNLDDNECCFDFERKNGQSYKTTVESCNGGQISLKREGRYSESCGTDYDFDPAQNFCCNGKKYKIGSGQCCSEVFSDIPKDKGRCCILNGRVYSIGDKTNPCLDKCNRREMYDVGNQLCCQGRVHNSTGNNYCCGIHAINANEMGCCGNQFPYRHRSRKRCCSNVQVYNSYYSKCAKNGMVQPKTRGRKNVPHFCSPLTLNLFDGAVHHACVRAYGISGRVVSVGENISETTGFKLYITIGDVKSLRRNKSMDFPKWTAPKTMQFVIDIPKDCFIAYIRKKFKKVIILFDSPSNREVANIVEVTDLSSFFITRKTSSRRYAVTKAISKNICKTFSFS